MSKVFEYFVLRSFTRQNGRISNSRHFPEPHPDAKQVLDPIFERYDLGTDMLFWRFEKNFKQDHAFPWAIIFFEREYRLAGHIRGFFVGSDLYNLLWLFP
ncbi:MAG: hypothetical protein GY845_29885 [Planctomycetes bacterium]|nr:hypothetical protein [Planctomycetota bacterium]